MTVHCENVALRSVLVQLGRQAGAEIDLQYLEDKIVTDNFDRLPVERALRRLLAGQNYLATYRSSPRSESGARSTATLAKLRVTGAAGEEAQGRRPDSEPLPRVSSVLATPVELRKDSLLRNVMGKDRPSISSVAQIAFADRDAAVRREATEALAAVLEAHSDTVANLVRVQGITTVAGALRGAGGARADEFITLLTEALRTPSLRSQAELVRDELQQQH